MLYDTLIQPFADYGFMKRALVACICMAVSGAPLGVFLVLRRMSLMSEATSHAVLPGAALAFLLTGLSLWPMTLGGLLAGLTVALLAGVVTHVTDLKEDASFTAAYITSLALGVLLISIKGSAVDVLHILFGNVLAVDGQSLLLVGGAATISLLVMALIYRPMIMECADPGFLRGQGVRSTFYHHLFLVMVVMNLVASFQVLGTLMAVGMMILPAIAARFWTRSIDAMIGLSMIFGIASSMTGLLLSYHYALPSGPAIVLTASAWFLVSMIFGVSGGLLVRFFPRRHFHIEGSACALSD